jgi:hypothetical protein
VIGEPDAAARKLEIEELYATYAGPLLVILKLAEEALTETRDRLSAGERLDPDKAKQTWRFLQDVLLTVSMMPTTRRTQTLCRLLGRATSTHLAIAEAINDEAHGESGATEAAFLRHGRSAVDEVLAAGIEYEKRAKQLGWRPLATFSDDIEATVDQAKAWVISCTELVQQEVELHQALDDTQGRRSHQGEAKG